MDEIDAGLMQWESGSLSTHVVERILMDALADIWADCFRREAPAGQQRNMFREKLMEHIRCATGQEMKVI